MSAVFFKVSGALLLTLSGVGGGVAAAARSRERWHQVRRFAALLEYFRQAVHYRAIPAADVLATAALRGDFAGFGLEQCDSFSQIRLPAVLQRCVGTEIRDGLRELECAPRESACRTLQHLTSLCGQIEREVGAEATRAYRLYPRLGGCVGLLAAILLI